MTSISKTTHASRALSFFERGSDAPGHSRIAVDARPGVSPDSRSARGAALAPFAPRRPQRAVLRVARLRFGQRHVSATSFFGACSVVHPGSASARHAARSPFSPC